MPNYGTDIKKEAEYLEKYETWQEFVDRAESDDFTGAGGHMFDQKDSHDPEHKGFGYSPGGWYGTSSFAQALGLARKGWPEGRSRIENISNAVFAKTGSLIRKDDIYMDVTGAAIDIGTYMTGQPECFMDWQESDRYAPGKGKIVTIVVNVAASSGIAPEVLFMRGACVVALADSLERAGRRAEITLVMNSTGAEYRVLLKRPDQPLQLDQLAMAVAHPSAFRRIGFAVMEHWPKKVQDMLNWGYGRPYTSAMEGDITLPSAGFDDPQWRSEDKAVQWVLDNLKEQGIIIGDA